MKYVCSVCGYEYDPAENDNVPFDQLPDELLQPLFLTQAVHINILAKS